jgi:D-3-phosphoglycerate dehydrogenase
MRDAGDVIVYTTPPESPEDLVSRVRGAHTVVSIRAYCKFPAEVLEQLASTLKHLAIWGTGTDHVDLVACKRLGIAVSNTPGANADSMAEQTIALMLAACRRVPQIDASVKRGEWVRGMLYQLKGKTLGLIGTGNIGARVARIANAMGMKVIAWTYHPDAERAARLGVTFVGSLAELLPVSDVVSLHLLSTTDSRGTMGEKEFSAMKDGAIFVNTARGDIVDEAALYSALKSRKLLAAGLDVFAIEPVQKDNPLLSLENVVLSPHTGGTTPEALANGLMMCAENVLAFASGIAVSSRVV